MQKLVNISSLSLVASAIALSLIFTGCGDTDPDNKGNHLPDVNIVQNNKTVNVGTKVNLTSTALDIDGDALTYEWKFVSKPTGSSATLTTTTTKKTSFTADKAGKYVIQFIAKDVVDAVGKDTVTIIAKEAGAVSNSCTSYTEITSTTYNVDTVLDGCYKIDRYLEIAENKLLTIKAGSTLKFTSSGYISVKGALKAVGTATNPIIFTGTTESAGHWQGIQFDNAVDDRNELDNVIIEYAGSWAYGALYATGATKLKIRNSIIRNNKLNGFYFGDDVMLSEFSNVTSTKNEATAGSVHPNALNVIDGTSNFKGNNNDYLTVRSGTVKSNQTWNALTVPVLVDRYIEIASNKLVNIKAGSKFEFVSSGYISVNGALKAIGTAEYKDKKTGKTIPANPITFSGATKAAGQWQGIQFNNAVDDRNELDNIIIEHAGSWAYGALYATGATKLKIRNSIIRNNKLYGFYFGNEVELNEFTNVTSTNNEKTAGRIGPKALSAIDGTSDFTGNIEDDYLTVASGNIVKDQTWKALSVPVLVDRYIEIGKNALVTVNSGARFAFVSSGYISVNGAFKAMGTATKPILFTGATKSKGFWQGIQFNNAVDNRNELAHITVEYAGSWAYGAVMALDATVLNLHDSIIRNNNLFGLWISDTASVTNTNNIFTNNTKGNVHQN
ncbi:Fibronectin type III domain protein [hydrothermal vent metagenome]|uniref:Fibronectin type III domain protein n=1 Tax=hydrothermal vent metagenome TaxID=652676 RepID=A0A1W1BTD5_9ZZZZ